MADWKRMAVAGLKREREALVAKLQPELDRIDKLIAGFGGSADGAKKAKPKRRRRGNMQAAHDSMAVKRGTATPEQIERHQKRMAAKALAISKAIAADAHARSAARQSAGASLRAAAS